MKGGGESENILCVSAEWEESGSTIGGVGERGGDGGGFEEGDGEGGRGGGGARTIILGGLLLLLMLLLLLLLLFGISPLSVGSVQEATREPVPPMPEALCCPSAAR